MNKRGMQLLLENIIKLLVAIIVIGLILYAGVVLMRTYFGKPAEMQAKGTLDKIVNSLAEINEAGKRSNFLLTAPQGWYVVAFDPEHRENNKFSKPSSMFGKNCVCICQGGPIRKNCKPEICRLISMPLKQENELAFIEIRILDIYFTNAQTFYDVTFRERELPPEITDEERIKALSYQASSTAIDSWLESKGSPLAGLGKCIGDVSTETGIPSNVILAVAIHESNWGKSGLAKNCSNIFSIKSTGTECKMTTSEYIKGETKTISAPFEKYQNQYLSIIHFGKLISTSYSYEEAIKHKDDSSAMIYAIHGCSGPHTGKECVYATDPEWADKVIKILNQISAELAEVEAETKTA